MFSIKRLHLLLCAGLLSLTALSNSPQPNRINPVALGIGLFNQDTPQEVMTFGEYYHLEVMNQSDHEVVFTPDNTSKLTFELDEEGNKKVVLNTKLPKKEIVKLLEEYQFEKVKNIPEKYQGMNMFEKKGSSFSPVRTICVFGNTTPLTLTFLKEKK